MQQFIQGINYKLQENLKLKFDPSKHYINNQLIQAKYYKFVQFNFSLILQDQRTYLENPKDHNDTN